VQVVVADTGPLRYLVEIGEIECLPRLFGRVLVPDAVRLELSHRETPLAVRGWIAAGPTWLIVQSAAGDMVVQSGITDGLDLGEAEAIALAATVRADLVLMDDRAGVHAARAKGFLVTGTLGVLDRAARRGLVDLAGAFTRLRATNFRYPPKLMDELQARYEADRKAQ
jgi:predicted nucleic acid-binding protein